MNDVVFEVTDKTGRKIRLSKKQWSHIRRDHPNVTEEEVEHAIKNPLKIVQDEDNRFFYYQFFKHRKSKSKFLRVIVNYLNGDGFVITAHPLRDIR
jgi:calcineurin-like phosphoesterase family protein